MLGYEDIRMIDGLIMLICLIQSIKHYHRENFPKAIYFLLIVLIAAIPPK